MSALAPVLVAVILPVLGLSYLLQTDRWLNITRRIMDEPQQYFPSAIMMVAAGVAIGYGYGAWIGTWRIFVTLLGWLLALEGALILVLPGVLQKLRRLPDRFLRLYLRFGGLLLIILGGLLWRSMTDS